MKTKKISLKERNPKKDNKYQAKMQIKFLKFVVETLINKQSSQIVDLLVGKKDVNEFLIAKKLDLTINQTRNILYKLSDYGLVSFIRKKDKRKGWYIYFWTLNIRQSLNLLKTNLEKELENLESQLKSRKEKRYYLCNTCSIELTEEAALLNDFACPECEEIYELSDNAPIIKQLEKEISKIKKESALVSSEIEDEEEKIEKKKEKVKEDIKSKNDLMKRKKKIQNKALKAKEMQKKKTKNTIRKIIKKQINKEKGKGKHGSASDKKIRKFKKTVKKVSKLIKRLKLKKKK